MPTHFASPRALATLAALFVTLAASPAAAFRVLSLDPSGVPSCDAPVDCGTPGTTCDATPFTTCEALYYPGSMDFVNMCVAPDYVRYCCEADADCPVQGSVPGHCVLPRTGDPSFGSGLCAYGVVDRCLGAGPRSDGQIIAACFRTTAGESTAPYGTVPWASGDCDGDGMRNDTDVCLCDPGNTCRMSDGGVDPVDAGMPIEPDAGDEQDAGTAPFDAGTPDVDANLPPGTGLTFRGAGGLSCDLGHGRDDRGGALAALLALGGVLGWRLRRRSRG